MNIAFGHTNMDPDVLGSLVFVRKIFPDFHIVKSKLLNPVTQNIYNFYQDFFDFLEPRDLDGIHIEKIIIVDTCIADRVKEYFSFIKNSDPEIIIIDHHPSEQCDILGAKHHGKPYGANTSALGKMAMELGIVLSPEEATIALTAIYADTGNFIYENVRREDYEVAAYLLDMGASLRQVKSFIGSVNDESQLSVLHTILKDGKKQDIQGHSIFMCYTELEENTPGLAAVVEKIMDLENPDACFAAFFIPKQKTTLLIGRSQKTVIDLHRLFSVYGGGGHQLAGSARLSRSDGPAFFEEFRSYLEQSLTPAIRARDIMTQDVPVIGENSSLLDASRRMEETDATGLPVLNGRGELVGFLSLRDIMKGRKAGNILAPVRAFMVTKIISSDGSQTMREIERIFYKYRIGHLPVIEGKKFLGIISRWDYLEFKKRQTLPNHGTGDSGPPKNEAPERAE